MSSYDCYIIMLKHHLFTLCLSIYLSVSLSLSLSLSVSLSLSLSVYLSVCQTVFVLSCVVCVVFYPSICLFVYLSIRPSVHLSVHISVYLFMCPYASVRASLCLFVCSLTQPCGCLSISLLSCPSMFCVAVHTLCVIDIVIIIQRVSVMDHSVVRGNSNKKHLLIIPRLP